MRNAIGHGLAVMMFFSTVPHNALAAGDGSTPPPEKASGLRDLRKAMDKAEERFLTLYNKVNRDSDQRLSCSDSAPTGTRLTQRSCSTRAQTRASEELARNYLGAMDNINADQNSRSAAVADASATAQAGGALTSEQSAALAGARNPDSSIDTKGEEAAGKMSDQAQKFENNLQQLLDKYPELQQRYQEFLAARQRFQQAGGSP